MTFPPGGVKRPVLTGALLLLGGCAVHGPLFETEPAVEERMVDLDLRSGPVELHLARSRQAPRGGPLVLYVTGDGGWRGADPLVFRTLVRWGYPAVGFEARDYLDRLGKATPRRLAGDYGRIIGHAEAQLGLRADSPTVLVGFSRGAALAVLAAGQRSLRHRLVGVVAVALIGEEETLRHETGAGADPRPLDPYRELSRVGSLPVAVIQSTNDSYLDAARARQRFGPDTATRHFVAVDSDGHTFGGARDRLLESLESALEWIASIRHIPPPREESAE